MEKEVKGHSRPGRASKRFKKIQTTFEDNDTNNNHNGTSSESCEEESYELRKRNSHPATILLQTSSPAMAPKTFMNNLPYMGELTFDTRPRRGRKPKKADICHLISKNYGIQFPHAYVNEPNDRIDITPVSETPRSQLKTSPSKDVSWSLISSLAQGSDEPLNLCLRDSSDSPSITSNVSLPLAISSPLFPISRSLINSIPSKSLLSSFNLSQTSSPKSSSKRKVSSTHNNLQRERELMKVPSSFKESSTDKTLPKDSLSSKTSCSSRKRDASLVSQRQCNVSKSRIPNTNKRKRTLVKPLYKPSPPSKYSEKCSQSPNNSANQPTSSSSTNTAEVSICKFKFTGGARPSLQEKKMLSVDSVGNFRFFSDKPCSLKQEESYEPLAASFEDGGVCGLRVPKSAKAMSACMIPAFTSASTFTEERGSALALHANPDLILSSFPSQQDPDHGQYSSSSEDDNNSHEPNQQSLTSESSLLKRKRRTRKSLMREKLEKTFKEKGFLIQTQQLESAEGATYCKFRQLRKFTRYLFRSWRDYLPENVKGLPGQAGSISSGGQVQVLSPAATCLNESNQSSSSPIIKYEDDEPDEQNEDEFNEQFHDDTDEDSERD